LLHRSYGLRLRGGAHAREHVRPFEELDGAGELQLVRHRGPRLQVIAQLRLEALIYAIEPKSGDQRREPAMHECGVIDHDEERLGEQPCAVAPGGRKCLRVREITWGKIRVEV